ncbi:M48 family metalloprotease [Rhodanobacter sp. L36]|uniref:M48 family metalloprotease n=1 Tax=Rhodanobacter sp. L36 TaxID=1747221 RepID=UPI00131B59CE|nr:M48 family metalloprotease [Rhodanobacter sp. L36]
MTMAPRRFMPRLLTALITAALAVSAGAQDDVRLPDLGSSANALISPQEADDYGASMLREMRSLDMVVDDPLLDDYINDLGYRLAANCGTPKVHFEFFVVKDSEINAFAAPGGYIAVNSGTITTSQNESELAGVIAHEIGHITQHHLERAFEDAKKDAPLMALVLLGAIAAGTASHSGDAPMSILAGGQGLLAQKSINFTRHDEIEADRVGIQTLANAGFDPNAMANFFTRMQDVASADAGGIDVPSLLKDHPLTTQRISDAKSRAGALIAEQKAHPTGITLQKSTWEKSTAPIAFVKDPTALGASLYSTKDGIDTWALMRERVRVLAGDAPKLAIYYSANLQNQHGFDTPSNRYGYALALIRSGRGSEAIGQLQPLLKSRPTSLVLKLALADARLQAGQRALALDAYKDLNTQSPRNRAVALAYADALAIGDKLQAATAANLLRPLLDNASEPEIFSSYARASEKSGDSIRAGEAFADASYYSGRPFDALEQLKRLLKRNDLDYYARARIQGRLIELTPLVMELHKRKIKTDDNPDGDQQQLHQNERCSGRLCFGLGAQPFNN